MFNIRQTRVYGRVTNMFQIARRYLVLNGFDGLYTTLGIIVGSYFAGHHSPNVVLGAGLAGVLALGVSGAASAYLTERAERGRTLKELERSMLTDLHGTVQEEAAEFASFFTAIVNGFSPVAAAFVMLSPFFLAVAGLIPVEVAFPISMIIAVIEVFTLGYYLGCIHGANRISYGMRMLAVAVVTAIIGFAIGKIFG